MLKWVNRMVVTMRGVGALQGAPPHAERLDEDRPVSAREGGERQLEAWQPLGERVAGGELLPAANRSRGAHRH
eukprot:1183538-Prorocentrum_minimum.AAC.2